MSEYIYHGGTCGLCSTAVPEAAVICTGCHASYTNRGQTRNQMWGSVVGIGLAYSLFAGFYFIGGFGKSGFADLVFGFVTFVSMGGASTVFNDKLKGVWVKRR